jgi:hypothetical protein
MEMSPLQEAWQIRVTTQTMRIKAQTAYLEAKGQRIRAREQQECLHLQQAMPGAHAWVIELTAWLLVARDLDADGNRALSAGEIFERWRS